MNSKLLLLIAGSMLIAMCLTSCSEQKRCARYVKKHPACFPTDTTWKDTTIQAEIKHDTIFQGTPPANVDCPCDTSGPAEIDTFINRQGDLTIKTVVDWKKRKAPQSVEKPPVKARIPTLHNFYPVIVYKEKQVLFWWAKWIGIALTSIILLLAVGRVKSK